MFFTCSSNDPTSACPMPATGSKEDALLQEARSQAKFALVYPCQLPAGESLDGATVTGTPERQQAELSFGGAFDIKLRQSTYPPTANPDPSGARARAK
jgi:hypothetical protein